MRHQVQQAGLRIDRYCSLYIPEISSLNRAKKWIKQGYIQLNGKCVETSRFVDKDDVLTLQLPVVRAEVWKTAIRVLFEDEFLAVVYKPPGLPVGGNRLKTLRNALPSNLRPSQEADRLPQPEPVHRLDKRTQGLLIIAKTNRSRHFLGDLFQQRQIHKEYQCLCIGQAEDGESRDAVDGKPALSKWSVLSTMPSYFTEHISHLKVHIFTGRHHQIRKHLFWKGHPVLGDDLYCVGRPLRSKGLFLFATGLRFQHPISQEAIEISLNVPDKIVKRLQFEQRIFQNRQRI